MYTHMLYIYIHTHQTIHIIHTSNDHDKTSVRGSPGPRRNDNDIIVSI